ncbi:C40 family peptidase [Roseospira marina]|uniref:C40 family peptidase n=1 Tax=Roseospira marina TaxID=140057 RepID=UPI0014784678|nr:NlpC/P60 family protein [Roseospira marina]MBB4315372.1 cell wall-associated NlpC family hydrolase [Roseospira marina]MBB5088483.1 cell wall-associated NlpC family hydrolase [Roseospira marina]
MTDLPESAILDLIGKPFAYGGRGPDSFDCYGLLMELYRRKGVMLPDYRSPTRLHDIAAALADGLWRWTPIESRPGAAVTFRIKGYGAHVGLVLRHDRFIHTWEGTGGVCIERLSHWKQRVLGFYDFADLPHHDEPARAD